MSDDPLMGIAAGVDRPWWKAAPSGLPWAEIFVPLVGEDGAIWTSTDHLADPIFIAEGVLEVCYDGPLLSFRRQLGRAGEVVGGLDALGELANRDLPHLQAVRATAVCRGPVKAWRLPLRRALFEADLAPLVKAMEDHLLGAFLRPDLVDILDRLLGWPGLDARRLHELVAGLPVRVVEANHRFEHEGHELPLVIWGLLGDDAGRGTLLRPLRADRGEEWWAGTAPAGQWLAGLRTSLVLVDRAEVAAVTQALAGEALAASHRTLRTSQRWQRMPSDLPIDAVVRERTVPAGTLLGRCPRGGWARRDPQGGVFFIVEGQARLRHWSRGEALGVRSLGPGSWCGGTAWLDAEVELQRLSEIHGYAFEVEATTELRVLVAEAPADPDAPVVEPITRLVRERLLIEVLREPLAEALRRSGGMGALPPEIHHQVLDRGRLVRLARGTILEPPNDEFFVFLRGDLVRTPGRDDQRRLFSPEPFSVLGMTEFVEGWIPVGSWEAASTCWLLRFCKEDLLSIRAVRRLLTREALAGLGPQFDKTGGAEIVLLHSSELGGVAVAAMSDLVGQAIAGDFNDPVLIVRLPRGETPSAVEIQAQEAGAPARVTLPLPEGDPREGLLPFLREWNRRFAWIFLVPVGREPGFSEALAPLVERLVLLTRDPRREGGLPVTADTAVLVALVLGEEGAVQAGEPGGPAGRGAPDGAVRLRIEGLLGRLGTARDGRPSLAGLEPDDRARLHRLGRAVTERRVALALGGGGAWGYVHVALILELRARGVPIDMVSGSSFGAVIGAMYSAAGVKGLELLVAVGPAFAHTMPMNYVSTKALGTVIDGLLKAAMPLRGQPPLDLPWSQRPMSTQEAARVVAAAGLDLRRILSNPAAWLRGMSRRPSPRLEELEIPFFPVATDLDTGAEVVLEAGPVALGVRASGSFPGIFSSTPHPVDGRPLVDGGIASNVPDRILSRQGASLIIASNPVPPPRRVQAQGDLLSRLPLLRRTSQGARSVYIMMHSMGQKDRRVVAAAYNSPPVEHGMTQVELSRDIVHQSYRQDEFRDAVSQAVSSWRKLSRPRALDVRADTTARDEQWTDLARTGWALVLPRGRGPESARYRALAPLLELRRAQAGRRDPGLYREFIGDEGMGPDEDLGAFLGRIGASEGEVDPQRLPYHVLIVASPEEIPLEPQVALDVEYAVGRLWLGDEVGLASYAHRVVQFEKGAPIFRPRLRLVGTDHGGTQDRRLHELLLEPMKKSLEQAVPGWRVSGERVEIDPADGERGEQVARSRLRRVFQGYEAPELLFLGAGTVGFGLGGAGGGLAEVGSPRIGPTGSLGAADLAADEELGPRMAMIYGNFSGGWQASSPFSFTEAGRAAPAQAADGLARFSQRLLDHPRGGMLAVMAKLDLAWVAATLRPTTPEAQAVSAVLEMIMRGRTVGSAMQSISDYYRLEAGALREAGAVLSTAEQERRRVCAVNARSWLLLGDPAVRLVGS